MVLRKLSQSFKVTMALMLSVLSSGLTQVAPVYAGNHDTGTDNNIEICHATGSESNPYIANSPAKSGNVDGHDGHHGEGADVVWYPGAKDEGVDWDDIIPEFTYTDENNVEQTYPGKNLTTEGRAILENGCNTPTTLSVTVGSECVEEGDETGSLTVGVSGTLDYGSRIIATNGTDEYDFGPITASNEDELPVTFSGLSAGTYTVTLEKGGQVYATETVTIQDCNITPTPAAPTATAEAQPCVEGDETTDVIVEVTNTTDDTDGTVTYTVEIDGQTEVITDLEDGDSDSVTFSGLAAGEYTVTVTGDDDTEAEDVMVTVTDCNITPTPAAPTATAEAQPCVEGDETTDVIVEVTNTTDDTDGTVTYTVEIDGQTEVITDLEDGDSDSVTFSGLAAGEYTVTVTGDDDTEAEDVMVTVTDCGGRGGNALCTVSNNTYFMPWTYGGDTYPEANDYMSDGQSVTNNGTFEFKSNGLYLSTPGNPDYVFGLTDAGNTKFVDVEEMSYMTLRELSSTGASHLVPAYVLYVDLNGAAAGGEDYLIYEPIYTEGADAIQTGVWQTWDTYKNGDAKYWSAYGTTPGYIEWSDWVENNPDGVVLGYGFNQGTGNPGLNSAIQSLEFDCATTKFGMPQVLGEDDEKKPVVVTGGQGGGNVLGAATQAVLPAVLPSTGAKDSPFMIIAAALLAYGAAYFLQGRRLLGRKEALSA